MKNEFMSNFIFSLIIHIAVSGIVLLNVFLLGMGGRIPFTIIWLTCLATALYLFLGSKLKPLKSGVWNYLSVSSSFMIMTIFTTFNLIMHGNNMYPLYDWLLELMLYVSFGVLANPIVDMFGRSGFYILAILPSIFMWLGLTYKKKKVSANNSSEK